jgi:AraC-like DNA-binding protein
MTVATRHPGSPESVDRLADSARAVTVRSPGAFEPAPGNAGASAAITKQRADKVFVFEKQASNSPFVERIWRTRSEPVNSFISVAESHWEMVVISQDGKTQLWVRGPETRATTSPIPRNAQFFGIVFRHGTFMPYLPVAQLVDGSIALPAATGKAFWLNSSIWEFPQYENADSFITRLVREGLIVRDPLVESALHGRVHDLSVRSVERRVLRSTGLTRTAIRQIERAHAAVHLLDQGLPILDTVAQAGYADQAHLTRSLKRFIGQTPAETLRTGKAT